MEETIEKKSNKKEIIIAIVAILLAALGFWMISRTSTPAPIQISAIGEVKGNLSLNELSALGKPLKCTFNKVSDSVTVDGVVYLSGDSTTTAQYVKGLMRGDFKITGSPVGPIESHFITRDNFSYTWTSLAAIGYKKAVTESAQTTSSPEDQASIIGEQDKVSYDCTPWMPDQSQFELPSNITFKDLQ